jgi:hypothetical protein
MTFRWRPPQQLVREDPRKGLGPYMLASSTSMQLESQQG